MDELRFYENYDEWEGHTVSAENYNELLWELEEKKDEIARLKEDNEYLRDKIDNLNNLIKEMDLEIRRLDKKDV